MMVTNMQKIKSHSSFSKNFTAYQRYLFGILCKIMSLSCFCIISLEFEGTQHNHNMNAISQFGILCAVGCLFMLPIILLFFLKELKQANFMLYPLRSIISIAGMVTWIEAVKNFGASPSILVLYTTPIMVIVLASFTKYEKLNPQCLVLGLLCYAVVFIALKTEISVASYGFYMAATSSVLWSFYELICKKQTAKEHFMIQVFLTFFFASIFMLPYCYKDFFTLNTDDFIFYIPTTILRIMNVILLFLAIKFASLNWLTPISYTKFFLLAFWTLILRGTFDMQLHHVLTASALILINVTATILKKKSVTSE